MALLHLLYAKKLQEWAAYKSTVERGSGEGLFGHQEGAKSVVRV
jgi:hypothetical protein